MTEPQTAAAPTLVTGATGFTGSYLVRALVADGAKVRVIARSAARARAMLPPEVEITIYRLAQESVIDHEGRAHTDEHRDANVGPSTQ